MKTPTKRELKRLAVEALGEGATVEIERRSNGFSGIAASHDSADAYLVDRDSAALAAFALAAALRALAEVRK